MATTRLRGAKLRGVFGRMLRRGRRALSAERLARARRDPVDRGAVLYESFAGNGMLCNPEAVFRYLLEAPEYSHLRHVWALSTDEAVGHFQAEFSHDERVTFVHRGSVAYWRALSSAGFLINNSTFPAAFGKRPGQVYLNTWHGSPLKRMGFDMPGGAVESANVLRNLLMADYLLAANPFMAETMYEDAYRLRNVYGGLIIEEGYPRIDRQHLDPMAEFRLRGELEREGLSVGDRRIVLYAPTWRGSSFSRPVDEAETLLRRTVALQSALGGDVVVLLKTHQVVHTAVAAHPELEGILVPNDIPTNVLLGTADALVTDYSSIMFDYLATGRPIAYLLPDAAEYGDSRGTYLSLDELPGPTGSDAASIGTQLRTLMEQKETHPLYRQWAERFVPFDDGAATRRVVDIVFRGAREGYRVRPARTDGRRRLLLSLGGMRANGITTSALNLLKTIDDDRYDVTVLMPYPQSAQVRGFQAQIAPGVRQVFRMGGMNGSKLRHVQRRWTYQRGTPPLPRTSRWNDRIWSDEWKRVFGSAKFDWLADFSGYSPLWANLILHSPQGSRAIWLHNEMAADRLKRIGKRQPKKRSLAAVFALYRGFDQLISVSPSLRDLNRETLSEFADPNAFVALNNLPDVERVNTGTGSPLESIINPGELAPGWLRHLQQRPANEKWFISVGRQSPEKNHARLIRAFAQVHTQYPNTRLILVGTGPLKSELQRLIAANGLTHTVFLTGHRGNPFALMSAADCFVLSSNYEGQPMVFLEAALCRLPIISTAFSTVTDALPDSAIHIVEQSDEGVRDGMIDYMEGRVRPSKLNAQQYTADVLARFDALVNPNATTDNATTPGAAPS